MQGSIQFATYESTGIGLDSSTANLLYDGYSFNSAIYMLVLDFIIFFLLGLYLDKVIPSQYGQYLKPFFCCSKSYWMPNEGRV